MHANMFNSLRLLLLVLAALVSASPYFPESKSNQQESEEMDHVDKRMLSAAFKEIEQCGQSPEFELLNSDDVQALQTAKKELLIEIKALGGRPLVIFLGNSPAYIYQAITDDELKQFNIHVAPFSGAVDLPGGKFTDQQKIQDYSENVLKAIVMANSFDSVVLVDVVKGGGSKDWYKQVLIACEGYMSKYGVKKGSLSSPNVLRIADSKSKGQSFKPPFSVPLVGNTVYVPKDGLMDALSDGEYPRIEPNYPVSVWSSTPDQVASQQDVNLDGKGRPQTIAAIKNGGK